MILYLLDTDFQSALYGLRESFLITDLIQKRD